MQIDGAPSDSLVAPSGTKPQLTAIGDGGAGGARQSVV
jgi:hypothetical protein